jgi:DNA-directed RNA polymerase sigma subunit (sigma70/sigma32)
MYSWTQIFDYLDDEEMEPELEKLAATQDERDTEIAQWRDWKATKNPQAFEGLVDSYKKVFAQNYKQRLNNRSLPAAAINSEQLRLFIGALDTYDPTKAQLSTHVFNHLQKASRYVRKYQNIARQPERTIGIGRLQAREQYLNQFLGRMPTAEELADDLAEDPADILAAQREVNLYNKEKRKELTFTGDFAEATAIKTDPVLDKLYQVHAELNPEQRSVLEHKFGLFGKQQINAVSQIGNILNMTPARVRTVNRQVKTKVDDVLGRDTSWRNG